VPRIVCFSLNSCLDRTFSLHRILFDDINRVEAAQIDAGGKGNNVAVMAGKLGSDARVISLLGGQNGAVVGRMLRAEGIRVVTVRTREETRAIYNFVETATGRMVRINEKGPAVSPAEQATFFRVFARTPFSPGDFAVLSGSLPPGMRPDTYDLIIRNLNARKVLTVLDADNELFKRGIAARPFLIKPNLWELERAAGRRIRTSRQVMNTCRSFLDRGIGALLLTLGGSGAVLFSREGIWRAWHPPVHTACTVGCGDAFLAGFLHTTAKGEPPSACLAYAVACGTAKACLPGTGMPDKKEVERARKKIRTMTVRTPEEIPSPAEVSASEK